MASIETLLDEMDEILSEAKGKAFSSRMTVDVEALRAVMEDIRINMPEEIKQAKVLASERREIMSRASREYEATVEDSKIISRDLLAAAEKRAKDMNAETNRRTEELMRIAQEKSKKIIDDARTEADRIISQQNIVIESQVKAEEIKAEAEAYLEEAKKNAQRIVDDTHFKSDENIAAAEKWSHDLKMNASAYVDDIVAEAEYRLAKSYAEIKKLQDNLDKAAGKSTAEKREADRRKPTHQQENYGMTKKHKQNMMNNAKNAYGKRQKRKSTVVEDDDIKVIRHQSVIDIPLDDDTFANSFDDPPLHERSNYNIQL